MTMLSLKFKSTLAKIATICKNTQMLLEIRIFMFFNVQNPRNKKLSLPTGLATGVVCYVFVCFFFVFSNFVLLRSYYVVIIILIMIMIIMVMIMIMMIQGQGQGPRPGPNKKERRGSGPGLMSTLNCHILFVFIFSYSLFHNPY